MAKSLGKTRKTYLPNNGDAEIQNLRVLTPDRPSCVETRERAEKSVQVGDVNPTPVAR